MLTIISLRFPFYHVRVLCRIAVLLCLLAVVACQSEEERLEPVPYQVLVSIERTADITFEQAVQTLLDGAELSRW